MVNCQSASFGDLGWNVKLPEYDRCPEYCFNLCDAYQGRRYCMACYLIHCAAPNEEPV